MQTRSPPPRKDVPSVVPWSVGGASQLYERKQYRSIESLGGDSEVVNDLKWRLPTETDDA